MSEICRRLDGVPLAIELAAALVGVLSPAQIAARLDDRFSLLTSGSRTALPRHQTLLAALEWSHDLLAPTERVLLRRLSVFHGGFTLEAVEEVCGDGEKERAGILGTLSRLVTKSLVVSDADSSEVRYRLLETVWQYAAKRLIESGEEPALQTAHAAGVSASPSGRSPSFSGTGRPNGASGWRASAQTSGRLSSGPSGSNRSGRFGWRPLSACSGQFAPMRWRAGCGWRRHGPQPETGPLLP